MNRFGANLTKVRRMIPVAANLDGPLAIEVNLEAAPHAAVGAGGLSPTMTSFVHHDGNAKGPFRRSTPTLDSAPRALRLPVTLYEKSKRVYF